MNKDELRKQFEREKKYPHWQNPDEYRAWLESRPSAQGVEGEEKSMFKLLEKCSSVIDTLNTANPDCFQPYFTAEEITELGHRLADIVYDSNKEVDSERFLKEARDIVKNIDNMKMLNHLFWEQDYFIQNNGEALDDDVIRGFMKECNATNKQIKKVLRIIHKEDSLPPSTDQSEKETGK